MLLKNKITWNINLCDRHGIEKYPFGNDGELTLICEKRNNTAETPAVTIESNVPVTVELIWDGQYTRFSNPEYNAPPEG